MSTASPLPLEPLPPIAVATADQQALRQQVAARLEQHRLRRAHFSDVQGALPGIDAAWPHGKPPQKAPLTSQRSPKGGAIADSVAARFAKSQTYREFLQEEAEAATRQAEAAAEIARRNADAIAAAQQQLLDEMAQWERNGDASQPAPTVHANGTAQGTTGTGAEELVTLSAAPVLAMPAPTEAVAAPSILAPSESLRKAAEQALSAPAAKVQAPTTAAPAARTATPAFALPVEAAEPLEPTTPIPANLIEFPRQLVAARKARPRLAEGPLREDADTAPERAQLRIFEVEASSFSTTPAAEAALTSLPEWSSIRLESSTAPHELTQPDAQVSLAIPVYAAPLERRIMAAAVDGCCVTAAFLLAVAAAGMAGGVLPTGLLAAGAAAVTLLLFGVGYLLLCFSLTGQTAGMRYARIALCTFGDDNPTRAAMRRRLLASALCAGSLGLGFAWALLDDDKLGWHDRISRMYQRAY